MARIGLGLLGEPDVHGMAKLARRAEEQGFESIWLSETRFMRDGVTTAAVVAMATERVRVGTAVLNPYTRGAVLTAVTFATLDELAHGRAMLGIGAGSHHILEKQGYPFDKPIRRLREYLEVFQQLVAHETVTYHGRFVQVDAVKLDFQPVRSHVPIYLAATGPRALQLTGELADGVILDSFVTLDFTRRARQQIEEAARKAGRPPSAVEISSVVAVSVDADSRRGKDGVREKLALYIATFPSIAEATEFPPADEVQRIQEAVRIRGPESGAKLISDEMVDALTAAGTPDEVRARIRERREAGVDLPILFPVGGDVDLLIDNLADA